MELEGIREMDVCWYNTIENALYLIEVKDWGDGILIEEKAKSEPKDEIEKKKRGIYQDRMYVLLKKSIDSAVMLAAMRLETSQGRRINASISSDIQLNSNTTFHFINIINWTNVDITPISTLHTLYKSKFKGYRKLFGFRTPITLTKQQAIARFSWVS